MSLRNYIESTGSEFRNLKYSEVSNQGGPLIEKQISKTDGNTGGQSEFQTRVITPITARIDDVARITKLLTKAGGVRWELHQAELQAIQYNLENKRVGETTSPLTDTLLNVGKALVKDLGLTASTLAQVALSGTGEHQTTYISRAYLKSGGNSGILGTIGAATGITSGNNVNGGAAALAGDEIIGRPEHSLISPKYSGYHRDAQTARKDSSKYSVEGIDWSKVESNQTRKYFNKDILQSSSSYNYENTKDSIDDGINTPAIYDDEGNELFAKQTLAKYGQARREGLFSTDIENVENTHTNGSIGKNRLVGSGSYKYETLKEDFDGAVEIPELTDEYGNVLVEGSSKRYGSAKRGSILSEDIENVENIGHDNVALHNAGTWDGVGNETEKQVWDSKRPYITSVKHKTKLYLEGISGGFNQKTNRGQSDYPNPVIESSLEYKTDIDELGKLESLVPFILTTITPERRLYLSFQANLDSYDDSYTGEWEGTQYVGRAEKFYNYQGFDRKISFAFKVLAKNRSHLIPLYKNLNALVASTAPTYGDSGLFMRGTLTSVTIGDLLQNQIGFFTSVKLTWQQDYLWEIEKGDGYMRVPHALDVSVSFTPIHNFNVTADTWIGGTTGSYFGFDNSEVMNSVVENGNSENRKSQVNTNLRPNVTGTEDVLKENPNAKFAPSIDYTRYKSAERGEILSGFELPNQFKNPYRIGGGF